MRPVLLLAAALALASCDSVAPPDGFEGAWEWEYTSYGHVPGPTPESAGYGLTLTLDGGHAALHRDGDLVHTGTYRLSDTGLDADDRARGTVRLRFDSFPRDPALTLFLEPDDADNYRFYAQASGSRLWISVGCCDRGEFSFRRAEKPLAPEASGVAHRIQLPA